MNASDDAVRSARSCIVLGCGRSGTSLVAGLLAQSGYFTGSRLLPASELNRRGFFEDVLVNRVNEALLAQATDGRSIRKRKAAPEFKPGQRWLCALHDETRFVVGPVTAWRMMMLTRGHGTYCLKDPRFCYTLDAWGPFVRKALVVCVFREPGRTATSMLRAVEVDPGLKGFGLSFDGALEVWQSMYQNVLRKADRDTGRFLFVHYEQVLAGCGISRLESFLGARIDRSFVAEDMSTSIDAPAPKGVQDLYEQMCLRADYR